MSPNDVLSYLSSMMPQLSFGSANRLEYEKFECYFSVIVRKAQISCFLRMNTINDNQRYHWVYAEAPQWEDTPVEILCAPLLGLLYELVHLKYIWEAQSNRFANGTYIKGSLIHGLPVYDGSANYIQNRTPDCMGVMPYILSLSPEEDETCDLEKE